MIVFQTLLNVVFNSWLVDCLVGLGWCSARCVSLIDWPARSAGLYDEHPDFMEYYERFIGAFGSTTDVS